MRYLLLYTGQYIRCNDISVWWNQLDGIVAGGLCNANRFTSQDFPLPVLQRRWMEDVRRKIWLLFIQQKEKVPPSADSLPITQSTIALFNTRLSFPIALRSIQESGRMGGWGREAQRYQRVGLQYIRIRPRIKISISLNLRQPHSLGEESLARILCQQTPNPRSNENLIYSISRTSINILSSILHTLYFTVSWAALLRRRREPYRFHGWEEENLTQCRHCK